jgi:hypothetical protein
MHCLGMMVGTHETHCEGYQAAKEKWHQHA